MVNPFLIPLIFLRLGVSNSCSLSLLRTILQTETPENTHGKVASTRQMFIALWAALTIPVITFAHEESLLAGLLVSGFVMLLFPALILLLENYDIGERLHNRKRPAMTP